MQETDHLEVSTATTTRNPPANRDEVPWYRTRVQKWKTSYQRSFVKELVDGLNNVNFGDRIIIFGASLLLSVLPLVILLSAYANHRIDDDISRHLGLSAKGDQVIEGLFRVSNATFNLGVLIGLIMCLAGTIAVARSVQAIYERAFDHPPAKGPQNTVRCFVWVVTVSALVVADGTVSKRLRDAPAGAWMISLIELALFTLFFWWSMHYLLHGREPWSRILPAAVTTGLFWIGLGLFAAFYFSSSTVSDSKTYGPIGVTFDLVTWFIAIGAVLTLGAVVGAVWQSRRERRGAV